MIVTAAAEVHLSQTLQEQAVAAACLASSKRNLERAEVLKASYGTQMVQLNESLQEKSNALDHTQVTAHHLPIHLIIHYHLTVTSSLFCLFCGDQVIGCTIRFHFRSASSVSRLSYLLCSLLLQFL